MEEDQQFCLRWNNHQSTLISVFDTLLENGTLVDCTLAAEGKFLKAHKVVLSACSPYFATLLSEQYDKHPIFILKDVKYQELRAMMDYMYRGEVNISQDQLAALLKAAESLQIKGLSDNRGGAGSGGSKAGEPQKHSTTGHHVPGKMTNIGHMGAGYTLEQAKRARIGPSSIDSQDIGGSREGSSSPTSRRRKKIRRRSVDNVMGDNHENSNSSQNMQINSSVTGPGAITTSIVPSGAVAQAASGNQIQTQTNKKTDNLSKLDQGVSVSTINQTASATATVSDDHDEDGNNKKDHHHLPSVKKDKEVVGGSGSATSSSDIVIEPKSEYDDGNEETVEDLTLDDEMALDELDQTAGPSHGGEGSSQGYAQWQVDRSHDESYMAQDVQQRDPQDADGTSDGIDDAGKTESAATSTPKQDNARIRVRNWFMMADKNILEKENALKEKALNKSTSTRILNKPNILRKVNISNNKQNTTKPLRSPEIESDDDDDDDENLTDFVVKIEQNISPSPSSSPSSLVMNLEGENSDDVDMNGDDIEDEEKSDDDGGLFDIRLVSPMSWSLDHVKTEHEELDIPAGSVTPPPHSSAQSSIIQHTSLSQLLATPSTPKTILNRLNSKLPATIPGGATIKIKRSQEQLQQQQLRHLELQRTDHADKKYRVLLQNAKVRKESLEHSSDMIYNAELEKPWVCRNCNRTYKWKNSLKCHLKNECGQPPRFFCKKMCGYATNVHSNLKRHLNTKCRDREDDITERYEITLENN